MRGDLTAMTDTIGVAILGSTGSIGRQTLEVIAAFPDRFRVVALTARSQTSLLSEQCRMFKPEMIAAQGIDQIDGRVVIPLPDGLLAAATHLEAAIVVVATAGHDAIVPILHAIRAGKTIAIANKEALVCAGQLIMPLARALDVEIRPVDSEHSAIWQALRGSDQHSISRLILTASGGPFRTFSRDQLAAVTVEQALNHPNWEMGSKVTIDSATLMNKGLELIEAHWLFDMPFEQIEVVVHPQSLIHSMVEFVDGSVIAQLGAPDMRLPIQHALTFPDRIEGPSRRLDVRKLPTMTFEEPDIRRFPALRLAREAGKQGQTYPTVLSAVDEVAVQAFAISRIGFLDIARLVETIIDRHEPMPVTDVEVVLDADRWAREESTRLLRQIAG